MSKLQPVMSVTAIHFERQKSNPVKYLLWAEGKVSSGGWSGARLENRMYIRPPEDGIQDFDFYAIPPSKPSGSVISDIDNQKNPVQWPDDGWIRGFRVHAYQNSMETTWGPAKGGGGVATASLSAGVATQHASPMYEDRAPTVLTGVLQKTEASFCMDNATHLLLHGMGGTRLKARTPEAEDALQAYDDGKTRVVVAGHPTWGAECMHLAVFQVVPAIELMKLTDDRFVPFPWKVVPTK